MLSVIPVAPNECKWVNYKVGVEQHVGAEIQCEGRPVKEVEDGMWEAKHKVTDEHCQHGMCCLVQEGATARLGLALNKTMCVLSHLWGIRTTQISSAECKGI